MVLAVVAGVTTIFKLDHWAKSPLVVPKAVRGDFWTPSSSS